MLQSRLTNENNGLGAIAPKMKIEKSLEKRRAIFLSLCLKPDLTFQRPHPYWLFAKGFLLQTRSLIWYILFES